jgi:hypothetical protein
MLSNLFQMSPAAAEAKARKIIHDKGADKHLYKLHCGTHDYKCLAEGKWRETSPDRVFNFGINDLTFSEAVVDNLQDGGQCTIKMVGGEFAGVRFAVGGNTIYRDTGQSVDVHLHVGGKIAMNVVYDFGHTAHVLPHRADINFDVYYAPKGIMVRAYRRSDQMFPFLAKASKAIDRLAKKQSDHIARILKQGSAIRQAERFKF